MMMMMMSMSSSRKGLAIILLPIAVFYLSMLSFDVTEAIIEYEVEKPTLLSRTLPILPGNRLLSKRSIDDDDGSIKKESDDDGDSKNGNGSREASGSDPEGAGGRKKDIKFDKTRLNKSSDEESEDSSKNSRGKGTISPSTERNGDEEQHNDVNEEKADEGSRHIKIHFGPPKNLKNKKKNDRPSSRPGARPSSNIGRPKTTARPATVKPATTASTIVVGPTSGSTSTPLPRTSSTVAPLDPTGGPTSSTRVPTSSTSFPSLPLVIESSSKPSNAPVRIGYASSTTPASSVFKITNAPGNRTDSTALPARAHNRPLLWKQTSKQPAGVSTRRPRNRPAIFERAPTTTTSPGSADPDVQVHPRNATSIAPGSEAGHTMASPQVSIGSIIRPDNATEKPSQVGATVEPKISTTTKRAFGTSSEPRSSTTIPPVYTSTRSPEASQPSSSEAPKTPKDPNTGINSSARPSSEPSSTASTTVMPTRSTFSMSHANKPPTTTILPKYGDGITTVAPPPNQITSPPYQSGAESTTTSTSTTKTPMSAEKSNAAKSTHRPVDSKPVASMDANPQTLSKPVGNPHVGAEEANITRHIVNPDAELLLGFHRTIFDSRDVAYFLESHPAHSVHDPRVYFTSERTTRSLVILSKELQRIPERLRFAFIVRVFEELGRKIASKLNYYAVELVAVLKKSPDQLGNKPEVSMLVDAINRAFESKDDGEISDQAEDDLVSDEHIKLLVEGNGEKRQVFAAAMKEVSNRFAQLLSYFVLKATKSSTTEGQSLVKIPPSGEHKLPVLLGESLRSGAKTFILETAYDDKFRIPLDAVGYTNVILDDTISMMRTRLRNKDMNVSESIRRDFDRSIYANSFKDLNPISDKIGLIGSWNSFLFANLGTSERLVKVFGSLLSRVPVEAKARWINMYISQIFLELERTISGFVTMQGMPFHGKASELFLLESNKTIELLPDKVPTIRDNYLADKNRIPARCYLAGRRWRLVLSRGLDKFADKDSVIDGFANRVGSIKNRMMDQNGNDIYRLCLPRLEVGIRGWTIDGNPEGTDSNTNADKFPLKNPIEGLTEMRDPFASGVSLGFGIGLRVGYNEERNATLEMERANHLPLGRNDFNSSLGLHYVAMASFRKAATVGARKAFEIALREGYLASLKVSVRAGMSIPVETGSRISALKSVSFAGQAGQEAGKVAAQVFITDRKLSDDMKQKIIKVGQTHGLLAGEIAGESIGSIVGKAAAEEAYRRSIIRGGKVARAKFHLEEFEAGAKLGFDYGLKEGKKIASSSTLDPSAPRFFRLPKPVFSDEDEPDHEVDHWEKELIPPLSDAVLENLASVRDHTPVRGSLRGVYKVAKELKSGFKRISYTNVTYDLEVFASGFIKDNIAYLTLNGTVNKMGILRGSLIARDIFNDDE